MSALGANERGQRNAAIHRRPVRAFGLHPLRLRPRTGLVEPERERDTRPLTRAEQAMSLPDRELGPGLLPIVPPVTRAFDEADAAHGRHPLEVIHRFQTEPIPRMAEETTELRHRMYV